MAETDIAQQVAGIEVTVPLLEHVGENHLQVLFRLGIAVQRRLVVDLRQQQALPAPGDLLHEARAVADRRTGVVGVLHQRPGRQGKAHGIVEVEHVGKANIAVAGGIQLTDMLYTETLFERPHTPGRRPLPTIFTTLLSRSCSLAGWSIR
ncbi:hypothetical protein M5C90_28635 [Pseudomonas chlororaphis subsp. piscium]|nr:hypothetical protein M5C90_28635 [Pseudomonas chlororaphis subsp. piscium]